MDIQNATPQMVDFYRHLHADAVANPDRSSDLSKLFEAYNDLKAPGADDAVISKLVPMLDGMATARGFSFSADEVVTGLYEVPALIVAATEGEDDLSDEELELVAAGVPCGDATQGEPGMGS